MIFNSSMGADPQAYLSQMLGQNGASGASLGGWGFTPFGLTPWGSLAATGGSTTPTTNYSPLPAPTGTAGYVAPTQTQQQNPYQNFMRGFGRWGGGGGNRNMPWQNTNWSGSGQTG